MMPLLLGLLIVFPQGAGATAPADSKARDLKAALAEVARRRAAVRDETERQIAQTEAQRREKVALIEQLRERRASLEERETRVRTGIEEARREAGRLQQEATRLDSIRGDLAALVARRTGELAGRLEGSLVVLENPAVLDRASALLEDSKAGLQDRLASLLDIQAEEIRYGAVSSLFHANIVARDGRLVEAEVLRAGRVDAFYRMPDGEVGALVPSAESRQWHCAELSSTSFESSLRDLFDKAARGEKEAAARAPIDVTGGLAAREEVSSRTLAETFESGGLVMYPLAGVALLALLLFVERALFLALASRRARRLIEPVRALAVEGRWRQAAAVLDRSRGSAARLLQRCLELRGAPPEIADRGIEEAVLAEAPRIERFLGTLGTLGTVAPFLGLLGTITGMISTFNSITISGSNDPALLSSGISEALITTQAGLVIAIPILLLHTFLTGQVDRHLARLEQGVAGVTSAFDGTGDRSLDAQADSRPLDVKEPGR